MRVQGAGVGPEGQGGGVEGRKGGGRLGRRVREWRKKGHSKPEARRWRITNAGRVSGDDDEGQRGIELHRFAFQGLEGTGAGGKRRTLETTHNLFQSLYELSLILRGDQ